MRFPPTGWLPAASHEAQQRDRMRAGRPRSQAIPNHSPSGRVQEKKRLIVQKTNHKWTRMNTNRPEDAGGTPALPDGPPSTPSGAKMLRQFGALGVTMSWDDGFLGARASRPHQAWHSLGHLPHLDQPGTAPWLSFGLADAVSCPQGGCLQPRTEAQRRPKGQDAGGTPALPGDAVPAVTRWGVSGGRLLRKPTCALWEN